MKQKNIRYSCLRIKNRFLNKINKSQRLSTKLKSVYYKHTQNYNEVTITRLKRQSSTQSLWRIARKLQYILTVDRVITKTSATLKSESKNRGFFNSVSVLI